MNKSFSILVAGDLVLDREYLTKKIDSKVISLFKNSDLNIVNLEAPTTLSTKRIEKTGPNLKSHIESTRNVLQTLKIDVVTLANNHVLDYGSKGLSDTLEFCEKYNLKSVGAGLNLEEASQTLYLDSVEGKIAIVNIAENEWTSADFNTAGSNPMDTIDNSKQIQTASKLANFVIVIVHGGNEYFKYPSPRMVKQYRYYVDCGADAVIGHHQHCIGGFEVYNNSPIVYSLGNFIFTTTIKKSDSWYVGAIAKLLIKKNEPIKMSLHYVGQTRGEHCIFIPENEEIFKLENEVEEINKVILDSEQLNMQWNEFVETQKPMFAKSQSPIAGFTNRYLKAILYRSGVYKLFLHKKYLQENLNRIRCEAHHELTKAILTQLLRNK